MHRQRLMHRQRPSGTPDAGGRRGWLPFRHRRQPGFDDLPPSWRQARPGRIAEDLRLALQRSGGGWCVVGRSSELGADRSIARTVAGREITLWRAADGSLRAGRGVCPHLGALLDDCPVLDGQVVCRWHGLRLGGGDRPDWGQYPAHDDGALLWAAVGGLGSEDAEEPTVRPVIGARPPLDRSLVSVITLRGRCSTEDVLANRLDPWHGAWFHPYAFSHLRVDEAATTPGRLVVEVTFRLGRQLGVPVLAEFGCPDRRTIVMRIIDGEGVGSVVETHVTPVTAPDAAEARTVLTELTVAHSDRFGFGAARALGPAIRPLMRHTARRLWADDLDYAERRYDLRRRGEFPG